MTDFHELYRQFAGDVYRFALFLCGDTADAEDIAAETFARAIAGKAPVADATAKGYLFTIARNLYLEWTRHRPRLAEFPSEHPDPGSDPEQSAGEADELQAVLAYLQRFSEIDRTALLLQIHGVPYSEIASLLDLSLASARVRVHRLRLRLAEWRAQREPT